MCTHRTSNRANEHAKARLYTIEARVHAACNFSLNPFVVSFKQQVTLMQGNAGKALGCWAAVGPAVKQTRGTNVRMAPLSASVQCTRC